MKNLFSIAILIILGLLAYNHFNKTYTPDEQFLIDLEADFKDASKLVTQAERTAGVAGVDTTSSFEQGIKTIMDLRAELYEDIEQQKDEKIVSKSFKLLKKIDKFLTDQGYPNEPE